MLALTQSKADGTNHKLLTQLAKVHLLILDDWGLEPLKVGQRNDLMEIMDDRYGQASTEGRINAEKVRNVDGR